MHSFSSYPEFNSQRHPPHSIPSVNTSSFSHQPIYSKFAIFHSALCCFTMGNYISRRTCDVTGKVILPDGTIKVFEHPVAVGELMLEHPQQFVVEFGRPLVSGRKLAPLPADHQLEAEKVYLMLPMRRGKGVKLSNDEAREILDKARIVVSTGYFPAAFRILPRLARLCSATAERDARIVRARRESLEEEEEQQNGSTLMATTMEGRSEFLSRELSGRGWKPSLETIKEKVIDKKVPHWLF